MRDEPNDPVRCEYVGKTRPKKALIHIDNRKVAMEVGIL